MPPVAQPGLSADTVRIAVIADIDTGGIADNLFLDASRGVLAWAEAVNANGGLGGRQVVADVYDSRLFNHRQQLEEVCAGDYFAIVGSQSLGDFEGAEVLGSSDCNLADFPGDAYGARRAQSPTTIAPNPFLNDVRQAGPARWLAARYPEASQNVGLLYYTELQLQVETERLREMLEVGVEMSVEANITADLEEDPSERISIRWAEGETQGLFWHTDPNRLIELLEALEEPPTFVLCEQICYSEQFLSTGGSTVEGVYTWIPHSPFDSPVAPEELITYQFYLNQTSPGAGWSEIGLQSWMAGRLFEETFYELLRVEPEAPTRDQLVQTTESIADFTANDILPFTNPSAGEPTPCFVLMQVVDGRWVQVHPQPPRDKDCSSENLYALRSTLNLGVDTVASSSVTSEEVAADPDVEPTPDLENPEEIGDE